MFGTMKTVIRPVSHKTTLRRAVALVQAGAVIAVPTDTVYGLVCRYDSPRAIAQLFAVKERPPEKALPVLLGDEAQLPLVTAGPLPQPARTLMARFWPGPLTLVLSARTDLPGVLTAGGHTVAVRIPDHEFIRELARQSGPLASSSANLSGQPECRTAQQVLEQLNERIPFIADGGESSNGVASTVLDLTTTPPRILREGPVGEEIRRMLSLSKSGV